MLQDLRYAIRVLLQNPGVTILAVIALAMGIGSNAAIFTVVNGVLLRPLPYTNPESLVFVRTDLPGESGHAGAADPEIRNIRAQSRTIERIGWMAAPVASLTGDQQMEHVTAATASDDFLPVLGVQPVLGRGLIGRQDLGKERVENLLVSYELWQRRYQGDPNIIGRTIEVNNFTATIVGVLPQDFRVYMGADANVPSRIDVWFPAEESESNRRYHGHLTVARLRKGATLDQAQAEVELISAGMVQQYPGDYPDGDFRLLLVPLHEDVVKPLRSAILVLLGAVGFVLLIACANIANLMLARAAGRKKEIAIRAALGASRSQVVRQLLTESFLLALVGGVFGLLLARGGVDALLYLRPDSLPRQDDIVLDATVTAFTFALSMISGILFGLAPALHATKTDFNSALKDSSRSLTSGTAGNRVRTTLVIAQVALSLVLLVGAGLMIRTFANLRSVELGFDPANVLTFKVEVSPWEFEDYGKRWRFYNHALEVVQGHPGVDSVSGTGTLPLDPLELPTDSYAMPETPEKAQPALFSPILPRYFRTMRIPLIAGRDFTDKDNEDAAAVAIVDQQFAQRTWPGANPIGKRIYVRAQSRTRKQIAEIIGVARHVQVSGLREDARPLIYIPYRNYPTNVTMTVRTNTNAMALAAPLRKVVEGLGGRRPVYDVRLMSDYVSDAMAETRFALVLLSVMSGVAFGLSVIGIYGVVSYSVAERMQEFAIRMALGAQPRDIWQLALSWGVFPAACGIVIGIAGAFALTRFLSTLLFGVSPTDVTTYLGVSGLLFAAAILACYIPVRWRALRADPKTFLH